MKNRRSDTPLHIAAEYGHVDAVNFLLTNNADIEAKNCLDEQPIHMAAANGNFLYSTVIATYDNY